MHLSFFLGSIYDVFLSRVQTVARLILQTPTSAMVNTTVASDIMNTLHLLMREQRAFVVASAEAEDLLTILLYIFAPVSRIAETIVIFIQESYFAILHFTRIHMKKLKKNV